MKHQRPDEQANDATDGLVSGAAQPRAGTGTLGKAMEVLEIIASSSTPMRFTDVLNSVDQPRGTLHRQISNLIEEGLVVVNRDNSYSPGIRLLKLAALAWSKNDLCTIAEPHIRQLHNETEETVHLGQLHGTEVVYLDKIESRKTVRMHSQVGNASPLYCTGIGKAMLAKLPEADARSLSHQMKYIQHTPSTLASADKLLEELARIRSSGLSHDREEHEPGIYCVAAAFGGEEFGFIGGISVTAPAYRIDKKKLKKWEFEVSAAALAIENDLRARLGPRNLN